MEHGLYEEGVQELRAEYHTVNYGPCMTWLKVWCGAKFHLTIHLVLLTAFTVRLHLRPPDRGTKPRACAVVLGEEDDGKDAEFIADHRKDGLRNSKFNHFKNIEK